MDFQELNDAAALAVGLVFVVTLLVAGGLGVALGAWIF
jgi:hypothetical protein